MLQIQHEVPGRVRFRIQGPLPRSRATAGIGAVPAGERPAHPDKAWMRALAATLGRTPGVRGVRLNAACASLVVHYDPRLVDPGRLRAAAIASAALPGPSVRAWTRFLRYLRVPRPQGARQGRVWRIGPGARVELGCRVCALQRRLLRWLVRSTLRCWWLELRSGGRRRGAADERRRLVPRREIGASAWQPLLARPRKQASRGVAGFALAPVSEPSASR